MDIGFERYIFEKAIPSVENNWLRGRYITEDNMNDYLSLPWET